MRPSRSPRGRSTGFCVDGGDGTDTFALDDRRLDLRAAGDHVRGGDVDLDGVEIVDATADELTVGDLSPTDVFQVNADADRTTAYGSEGDDQISFGSFELLGPTFITLVNPSLDRSLTVDGRGGDDIISASSAAVDLTLVGGSRDNVLFGGPGDDHLIGGDGFDDVKGGPGEDVALLGGDFDRFSWKPGDGSDVVDGSGSRDSLSVTGSGAGEADALDPDGRGLRFTAGDVALALSGIEDVDPVLGGGEDTFAVGDLSRTGAQLSTSRSRACRSRRSATSTPTASPSPAPTGRRAAGGGRGRRGGHRDASDGQRLPRQSVGRPGDRWRRRSRDLDTSPSRGRTRIRRLRGAPSHRCA